MEEQKKMNDIIDTMGKSTIKIPASMIIAMLAGIINTSDPNNKNVKELATMCKDFAPEEIIATAILTCCNSLVISMWKSFEKNFETNEEIDIEKYLKVKQPDVKA